MIVLARASSNSSARTSVHGVISVLSQSCETQKYGMGPMAPGTKNNSVIHRVSVGSGKLLSALTSTVFLGSKFIIQISINSQLLKFSALHENACSV